MPICPADLSVHPIRAAVLRQKGGPLRIESLELEGPRDDEILVRLAASGICRTDVDFCDHGYEGGEPLVLGHEGAGVVEQVGRDVKGVRRGDHAVLSYQSCGCCRPCRSGHPTRCVHFDHLNFGFARLDGSNALERSGVRGHFFGQSSFATHALATERNLVRVARNLPLELLAPLGCGLQTGAGTVMNSLAVREGNALAVFGTGAVGLAAVLAARLVGAAPIIAVDRLSARLAFARELGATHAIDTRHEEVAAGIAAIAPGGVDFVLENTGSPALQRLAFEALRPQGTVALLTGAKAPKGLAEGKTALEIIQGDAVPRRFIPQLIEWYRAGLFPLDRLVKVYDFDDINDAMDDLRRGETVKPVLRMGR